VAWVKVDVDVAGKTDSFKCPKSKMDKCKRLATASYAEVLRPCGEWVAERCLNSQSRARYFSGGSVLKYGLSQLQRPDDTLLLDEIARNRLQIPSI